MDKRWGQVWEKVGLTLGEGKNREWFLVSVGMVLGAVCSGKSIGLGIGLRS